MGMKPRRAVPVVEREFWLVAKSKRRQKVLLSFESPKLFKDHHGSCYYCSYRIEGLENDQAVHRRAGGEDSLQALYIAMQLARIDLVNTTAYKEGRLTLSGSLDLGLPIMVSV